MESNDERLAIREVRLGATRAEGGTREVSYAIGGERDLPFSGKRPERLLVALEICDDPQFWPPVVRDYVGDLANDTAEWARAAERTYGADLVRLNFTSTKQRGFDAFGAIAATTEEVLAATARPLIVEGSNEPELDSEVFRRSGEAGEGERLLLGTAEPTATGASPRRARLRSCRDRPVAHRRQPGQAVNILLRETGVPQDRIVIDPYTGALGYGSIPLGDGRIRLAALAGDADLAMPMISAPPTPSRSGKCGRLHRRIGRRWRLPGSSTRLRRRRRRCVDRLRPPPLTVARLKTAWRAETWR